MPETTPPTTLASSDASASTSSTRPKPSRIDTQRPQKPPSSSQPSSAKSTPVKIDSTPPTPAQVAARTEAEAAEDLKFYTGQIFKIVKPVLCCITLSVLWVKISLMGSDFRPSSPSITVYEQGASDSTGQVFLGSLQNALIFIGTIIVATVVFVLLFKYGCHKFLYVYLFVTVITLLGFMGYLVILNILQVYNIPVDQITLYFCLWNFAGGGLMAIFWKSPRIVQQGYLVLMSSLMAFALNGFAEWTTWMVLAVLGIWDLIAVLCPYGPLKILIQSSRDQNREIPALLYSVGMIYFVGMADADGGSKRKASHDGERLELDAKVKQSTSTRLDPSHELLSPDSSNLKSQKSLESVISTSSGTQLVPNRASSRLAQATPQQVEEQTEEEDPEDRSGLKLGLGDFIFYSVLISRTAMQDWVTTIACFVAVMTGLTMTIFLLAIKRKALPALPISIAFGLLFYFLGSLILKPYTDTLSFAGVFI